MTDVVEMPNRQVLRDVYEAHDWDDTTQACRCGAAVKYGGFISFSGAGEPGSHARHLAQILTHVACGPGSTEDDAAFVYRVWRRHHSWHPMGGCVRCAGSIHTDDEWFDHAVTKLAEALEKRWWLAELTRECRFIGVLDDESR